MDLLPADTTLDARDRGATVALLPIGSFEQHGPYLPLTTDTLVASLLARARGLGGHGQHLGHHARRGRA